MAARPVSAVPYGRECFVRSRKGVIDLIPREKLWGKAVRREHFAVCASLFVPIALGTELTFLKHDL